MNIVIWKKHLEIESQFGQLAGPKRGSSLSSVFVLFPTVFTLNIWSNLPFEPNLSYMLTTLSMSDSRFEDLGRPVASLSSCIECYEDSFSDVKTLLLEVHAHIAAKTVPLAVVTTNSAAKDSSGASSSANPTHPFAVANPDSSPQGSATLPRHLKCRS